MFIGGGSLLLREYIVNSGKIGKYIFMEDVCVNAKGYKMLYEIQKRQVNAMAKKNPYLTTIGFNKEDPDHV